MLLKTVLEVCEFLGIKAKDNTNDDYIKCATCEETDGCCWSVKTEDGYVVSTNICYSSECGETTILYCKEEDFPDYKGKEEDE